jgi:hypothetical protein
MSLFLDKTNSSSYGVELFSIVTGYKKLASFREKGKDFFNFIR